MSVSDLYDDAVQVNCPVTFEKLVDVLQQWKHLCVGMTFKEIFPLVKSARMYAQSLFWKLFIQII